MNVAGTDIALEPSAYSSGLSMSREGFRALCEQIIPLVIALVFEKRDSPVYCPVPAAVRDAFLDTPLPQVGCPMESIVNDIARTVLPYPSPNGHPLSVAWCGSPPAPFGILGHFLLAAMNSLCSGGDHSAAYVEQCVINWLSELVGFPSTSVERRAGLLVSGGSMANLLAIGAALQWAGRADGWNVRDEGLQSDHMPFCLYASNQVHSSLVKAARLLGLGENALRLVPVTSSFQIDTTALASLIEQDRRAGFRPFCVVASLGTTPTGAIDPPEEIAALCRHYDLWLHADGAYGAFGILDPRYTPAYAGMEHVRSLALDAHKWLCTPVECSALLVRDERSLLDAYALVPAYLRDVGDAASFGYNGVLPWRSDQGLELTRSFRALPLWMQMRALGQRGISAHIASRIDLAEAFVESLEDDPLFEVISSSLSVVAFCCLPGNLRRAGTAVQAQWTKRLVAALQRSGQTFLTGTEIPLCGETAYALRACFVHFETTHEDLKRLVLLLRETAVSLQEQRDEKSDTH